MPEPKNSEVEINLADGSNTADLEVEISDRNSKRDHIRRLWALLLLVAGFFCSVLLDVANHYINASNEPWVSKLFTTSIVPILAFILGTEKRNN